MKRRSSRRPTVPTRTKAVACWYGERKGLVLPIPGCQAGAKGEHQGYKKSVSHLEYCFSVGLCKDSASRKLCQIYLDATEAPPVFCKDRARGSRSVLSEAAGGCLFAVKLVNFILSLPENIE